MSNSYFQFKQFRIEQSHCAMKVSTDACIQGAWTPIENNVKQVLDIGTGTGLLSLMLAQRNEYVAIDAIEIEEDAATQAASNFEGSPWSNRLHSIYGDAKTFSFDKKYDLIVCNPPFFKNSLLGDHVQRNHARHGIHFSLEDLKRVIDQNLTEDGYASVLLPATEHIRWSRLIDDSRFAITQELAIVPKASKPANRVVSILRSSQQNPHFLELIIRENGDQYSSEFQGLLGAYYLHL